MDLRCHSCSHSVGVTAEPVRIAGLFKASLMGKVARAHALEIRKRCNSCGWVNIFVPTLVAQHRMAIETKA